MIDIAKPKYLGGVDEFTYGSGYIQACCDWFRCVD